MKAARKNKVKNETKKYKYKKETKIKKQKKIYKLQKPEFMNTIKTCLFRFLKF